MFFTSLRQEIFAMHLPSFVRTAAKRAALDGFFSGKAKMLSPVFVMIVWPAKLGPAALAHIEHGLIIERLFDYCKVKLTVFSDIFRQNLGKSILK